ncbi:DNA-directed RNA polymerase subunit omega [Candidatus Nucleicultrix amoebiphila]|jgi:DNA-directed RNA polymerase subunit omega|uniref:DNA-directed RNA polymerase subunit omega n=1 Tax=Candidatus Nucleicultrix amoebiphila FS5 TaxID=1414854 RepID=A0A1W6N697_9PROT|nr:DNA-directed RNA polymerase subunit omega [Candidatus Nucleicultrix amoebiphila]ARN85410.1 hypothetical protein GQ61_09065 [Candidatus Nucleicultrix amoebiphila FS5]
MARVTVEDCIEKVQNRFELVVLAAFRTRQISAGAPLTIERDKDKNPVISLREIAEETIKVPDLRDGVMSGFRRVVEVEPEEEQLVDLLEQEIASTIIPSQPMRLEDLDDNEPEDDLEEEGVEDFGGESDEASE